MKSIGVLFIPIVLYFVPIHRLNEQHSVCLFKNILGYECYGCGMTRACISAIQLDFSAAFYYNKMYIVVLPILIYLWIKTLTKLYHEQM
jgi:hypothetical protein